MFLRRAMILQVDSHDVTLVKNIIGVGRLALRCTVFLPSRKSRYSGGWVDPRTCLDTSPTSEIEPGSSGPSQASWRFNYLTLDAEECGEAGEKGSCVTGAGISGSWGQFLCCICITKTSHWGRCYIPVLCLARGTIKHQVESFLHSIL